MKKKKKKREETGDCERFQLLIQEELDGRLLPIDREVLERHLETCPACRLEREKLGELVYFLDNIKKVNVPEGFSSKIMDETEKAAPLSFFPISFGWRRLTASSALAACLVLVLALFTFLLLPGMGESPLLHDGGKMGGLETGKIIFSLFSKVARVLNQLFESLGSSLLSMTWYVLTIIIGLFILINVLLKKTLHAYETEKGMKESKRGKI